ncbi:MAG: hypothetical protein H6739_27855 [Alphaproteobacteria bacterium]|nr:hypothetical protein [Alphaproteobacteria bacterium]
MPTLRDTILARVRPLLAGGTLLLAATLSPPAAADACTEAVLVAQLDLAERSFAGLDIETFTLVASEATETLGCLSAPVSPATAARVHLLHALGASLNSDDAAVRRACHAALLADPGIDLETALGTQPGSALDTHCRAMKGALAPRRISPPCKEAGGWVNGAEGALAYEGLPAVVQIPDDTCGLAVSIWVGADETLDCPITHGGDPPPLSTSLRGFRTGLTFATIGVGAITAAVWGLRIDAYKDAHALYNTTVVRNHDPVDEGLVDSKDDAKQVFYRAMDLNTAAVAATGVTAALALPTLYLHIRF